ncbi:unnamed protein product [Closterium sp. NIES-53]
MGEFGDASMFRVQGSRAFVHDTSADRLSARAILCVFLSFPPDASGWQFYHPTSRCVFPTQDVAFDESVPFYRLFPYRSAPPPPLPVNPLPPKGPAPSGVSQVEPLPSTVFVEVAVDSGAARGAASGGAASGGAEPGGAEFEGAGSGGAETTGVEPGGAEPEGVEPGVLSLRVWSLGVRSLGVLSLGVLLLLEVLWELHQDYTGARGVGATRLGGAGVTAGASGTGGAVDAGRGGARTRGTGAARPGCVGGAAAGGAGARDPAELGGAGIRGAGSGGIGAGGAGAGGARAGDTGAVGAGAGGPRVGGAGAGGAGARDTGAVDPGAGGAGAGGARSCGTGVGGTVQPRPYFVPLLQQVLDLPTSIGLTPPLLCPPPDHSQPLLQPASPLPAPSPYTEQTRGLTERREPESYPALPVRTGRRVPLPHPPPIPGTHAMALRPSSVPLCVPLPPPPASSLPAIPGPESNLTRAASPTLVEFASAYRLDYATTLVAESESASPPSIEDDCAINTDVLEVRQEDFECLAAAVPRFASMLLAPEGNPAAPKIPTPCSYAEAITGLYSSKWQTAMDAKMASWKSAGTYVDTVPPSGANIVDGMWILWVMRPSGSSPAFKARYVARGFSRRQGVD